MTASPPYASSAANQPTSVTHDSRCSSSNIHDEPDPKKTLTTPTIAAACPQCNAASGACPSVILVQNETTTAAALQQLPQELSSA